MAGSPAGQSRLLRLAVVGAHQHNDVIGDAVCSRLLVLVSGW